MNIIDIINKTKKSQELSEEEIIWLVNGFTKGDIPDYQMSAWLMAVCLNGLTEKETFALTAAMRDSGDTLKLNIPFTADKHSTGGVGDKTSLIIGPIVAACGVCVAKMSGRGLGHTGGTIDKLESIDGFRTDLSLDEFESILRETGFSIISQTGELCPADKKMYALRNATGTVDSIPLICASIMSKKLATNTDCLVLDVKYGSGAFMKDRNEAEKLARLMEKVGKSAGKKCKADVTDMDSPLGRNIGNALEVKEAVEVLQGKTKGRLYDICIELAADMLRLAGKGTDGECRAMAEEAVSSGKALDILRKTIKLHGGNEKICDDTSLLPQPQLKYEIRATKEMEILGFNCEELGMTSVLLGAGRLNKNDKIDMSAGIVMNCEIGDHLNADDIIMTLYSTVCSDFSDAAVRALNAVKFKITEKPSYT
ncbi:MAG: thymidine phosphorylase [Ruminococcus sp.]|uniref:thymidine phosphorylase n=1 Tax=Ruminococcus sp. TaxID=41978 RepID=UPI0025E0750C|nr:thymidine phosphorylase [Ruminococcus sp.]MBR5682624.1 thymidine phosphorylase [Ruminococcus sp.]